MTHIPLDDILKGISIFPHPFRGWLEQTVEAWRQPDPKRLETLAARHDLPNLLKELPPECFETFAQIFLQLFKLNQIRIRNDVHRQLLLLGDVFFQTCQQRGFSPEPKLMGTVFRGASRYAMTWLDYERKKVVRSDETYTRHLKLAGRVARTPLATKVSVKGSAEFDLEAVAARSVEDLVNHLHNRRIEAFMARLEFSLSLACGNPELKDLLGDIPQILVWARRLFDGEVFQPERIGTLLAQVHSFFPAQLLAFHQRLVDAWEGREAPQPEPVNLSGEVLTVEYVYRQALQEILGDGVITSDEEDTLRNLRDFLQIPPDVYQKIFQEVSKAPKPLNRDFDSVEFLRDLARQAMADGKLEDREHQLLLTVADSLMLKREDVAKFLGEAKRSKDAPAARPGLSSAFSELEASWTQTTRFRRDCLETDAGAAVLKEGCALLRKLKIRAASGKSPSSGDGSMLLTFHVPTSYPLPVLLFMTEETDIHSARLQFKGENMVFRMSGRGLEGLVMENRTMGRTAILEWMPEQATPQTIQDFSAALEKAKGKFVLAIVHLPSGNPVYFQECSGSIDLTGRMEEALKLRDSGKIDSAIQALTSLAEEFPFLGDAWTQIGHCYRALAKEKQGIPGDRLLTMAEDAYLKDLQRLPNYPESLGGLAMIKRNRGDIEAALADLEKAVEFKPSHMSNLLTFCFYGLVRFPTQPDRMLEFLERNLARAYNLCPPLPAVQDFLKQVKTKFRIDLALILELTEVDTRFH